MTALRFGVVGAGRIANDYLEALRRIDDLVLCGVADKREGAAVETGRRWSCRHFGSAADLVASGAEVVLVAVPPSSHEAVSVACLEAGAHVVCEKPFAFSVASAQRMLDAARSAGRVITMATKFRYVDEVNAAKQTIDAGALGRIVLARNVFASEVDMTGRWNSDPQISGGGVLIDNGTHSVDLLRYLFGPVAWVQAHAGTQIQDLPVEDTVRMTLGFRSRVIATVDLSWSLSTGEDAYLTVHGSRGNLALGWRGYDKIEALAGQLASFAGSVRGTHCDGLSEADILASVAVVEAAYESSRRHGAAEPA